mmetsp:Transcript_14161/g.56952  ORF Transcript_14161/g.56952 Transcript_14161/m.56952 type:complete len:82 (-) Transcript_14161:3101-3346(-)
MRRPLVTDASNVNFCQLAIPMAKSVEVLAASGIKDNGQKSLYGEANNSHHKYPRKWHRSGLLLSSMDDEPLLRNHPTSSPP